MTMKIVFFNGGLANQVFQYIFYRFCQLRNPEEEWVLDDSFFFLHQVHNGYELEKVFGLHPDLLSNTFDRDVWEYMLELHRSENKSVPQILLENGTDIKMAIDSDNWTEWNPFKGPIITTPVGKFIPKVADIEGNIYYHGYWIHEGWFHAIEDTLRKELVFPPIDEPHNVEYMEQIKGTHSCSLHVRRGDYVTLGVAGPDETYHKWITLMLEHVPDMTLFVFSDDTEYCKGHIHEMGLDLPKKVVFVSGNHGEKSFRDLQLMSCCKNMINGNSAFCYLAALLNKDLEGIISPDHRKV